MERFRKPFGVAEGLTLARRAVMRIAKDFLYALRHRAYLVIEVSAYEAKKHRENYQASNDKLDLLGIAKALLNRKGKAQAANDSITANVRQLCRQRRRLVQLTTAMRRPDR